MRKFFSWIAAHPYIVIGIVLLITLGFLAFIPRLRTDTDFSNYIDKTDPTVMAMERAEARYGAQSLLMVAVENEAGIFNLATLTKIGRMAESFEQIAGVDEVTSPLNAQVITGTERAIKIGPASPGGAVPETPEEIAVYQERAMASNTVRDYLIATDSQAATVLIKLKIDADQVAVAQEIIAIVKNYDSPPEKIYITGMSYMNVVLSELMGKDLLILLPLVILVIVLVLYFSFWSVRGVLLPLLVVVLSTLWTLGLMAIFDVPVTIISFILPVILMAIGIAYCIHVLNYYYEVVKTGSDRRAAVIETGLHMTAPVSMTGFTTIAGFLSLVNSFLIPQRQFGVVTAIGVCAAMVLSLVLIPALLSLLKVPERKVKKGDRGPITRVLSAIEQLVIRRRRSVLVLSAILFVAFLAGLPLLQIETSEREFLGDSNPVVEGMELMKRHFSGSEQLMIEIDTGTTDGLLNPDVLNEIVALQGFLQEKGVNKTVSIADLVKEMNQKFHADDAAYYAIPDTPRLVSQLLFFFSLQGGSLGNMALSDFSAGEVMGLYSMGGSAQRMDLVHEVQTYLDSHFAGSAKAQMVGPTLVQSSLYSQIARSQITSLVTSIIAAGLIVSILMGSLIAGLISLIPLLLTVVINFGVMAYSGTPLNMATLMVSSIAIGIGIDYAIHLISRFRREVLAGKSMDNALQSTIQMTGRGIAYNAIALALGFIILLASSFKGTNSFGLLIAMTMVISALSAFTVIPAILITWRPAFLFRSPWKMRGNDSRE
jgi:predicted RND superfamily exporter protein